MKLNMKSIMIFISIAVSLSGCQNEDKSKKAGVAPASPTCTGIGCTPGTPGQGQSSLTNVLHRAVGHLSGSGKAQLVLLLTGNGSAVAGEGALYVFQSPSLGCPIPVGQYTIRTETQGILNSDKSMERLGLIAESPQGSFRLVSDLLLPFQASPQPLACNGQLQDTELWGGFVVSSVNTVSGAVNCSSYLGFNYQKDFICQ